jgi:hypothetical protein
MKTRHILLGVLVILALLFIAHETTAKSRMATTFSELTDQRNQISPECPNGWCNQDGSTDPACLGGACSQRYTIRPWCWNGYCNQFGSTRPECADGNCDQTYTTLATCAGGKCNQYKAYRPKCKKSGCTDKAPPNPLNPKKITPADEAAYIANWISLRVNAPKKK